MEPPTSTDITAGRSSVWQRYKPRASARAQLLLAGSLWLIASVILAVRGFEWVLSAEYALLLLLAAIALAALKYRFILTPVALRAVDRIDSRGREQCAGGFLSWKSWLFVFVMMAGGHALRLTATPRPVLGVVYVTVSLALAAGGVKFLRAAAESR